VRGGRHLGVAPASGACSGCAGGTPLNYRTGAHCCCPVWRGLPRPMLTSLLAPSGARRLSDAGDPGQGLSGNLEHLASADFPLPRDRRRGSWASRGPTRQAPRMRSIQRKRQTLAASSHGLRRLKSWIPGTGSEPRRPGREEEAASTEGFARASTTPTELPRPWRQEVGPAAIATRMELPPLLRCDGGHAEQASPARVPAAGQHVP
jgi:hypothetical protein